MSASNPCDYVPFSSYDWSFSRKELWLQWNPAAFCLIASFCALAYWMSIELLVLVHVTFKRHTGLYFWSIIVTTLGIILQTTGYILKSWENRAPVLFVLVVCKVGWVSNVTGFSLVLWSRLHTVVRSRRTLKMVLAMILVDAVLFHTPVIVAECGLMSRYHEAYLPVMEICERIQQTVFSLQETIIGSLYIYHTARFLNSGYAERTRKVITLLISIQVLVILIDTGLTAVDYLNMFTLKCTIHPFVYSLKLKLEFIVLNQLLSLVKRGMAPGLRLAVSPTMESDTSGDTGVSGAASRVSPSPRSLEKRSVSLASPPEFITKAPAAQTSPGLAPKKTMMTEEISVAGSDSAASPSEGSRFNVGYGLRRELEEEEDLKDVYGRPDDLTSEERGEVDLEKNLSQIERQYLGRYGS